MAGMERARSRRLPRLLRNVLEPNAPASGEVAASFAHTTQELRVVLKAVVKPVLVRVKADQYSGRSAVPRNDDFLVHSEPQVPRQVILDLRERDFTARPC